eukprot:4423107-Karenia_brevis.AAC.1
MANDAPWAVIPREGLIESIPLQEPSVKYPNLCLKYAPKCIYIPNYIRQPPITYGVSLELDLGERILPYIITFDPDTSKESLSLDLESITTQSIKDRVQFDLMGMKHWAESSDE